MKHISIIKPIAFILLLGALSCGGDKIVDPEPNTGEVKVSKQISSTDIGNIDYVEYGLSPDSKKATDSWISYNQLVKNIDYLKEGDLSYLNGDMESLQITFEELKSSIPESLSTKSIRARILALETMVYKASSVIKIEKANKTEKLQEIKNVFVSLSHLHEQINKKFEMEANNKLR